MCLKLKTFHMRHTAKKDIVVFKGLSKDWRVAGQMKTPYRGFIVTIGNTYESELTKTGEYDNEKQKVIKKGIHSFRYLDECNKADGYDFVCECVIPKGSHYYKGLFEKYASYASDKLTYVEIIKG